MSHDDGEHIKTRATLQPIAEAEAFFDRRRFLSGLALAGMTVPLFESPAHARAETPSNKPAAHEHYINVYDFGARGDGKTDDTAAIQNALNAAGSQGGNVVSLPRGEYLIGGSLRVPKDVTLRGISRAPNRGAGGHNFGTLLLATGGKGDPNGTPLLSLEESGTLDGFAVFYPEQTCPDPPVEYPWTVRQLSDNASLVNVTLLNPWQAVDFGTVTGGRHYIRGLYAQPLKTGLFIDRCEDVGRVEDVHFWPFWTAAPRLSRFTANEATAFLIGRTDWEYMFNCFAIGHKVGFHFVRTPSGSPNVVLTQCGSDTSAAGTRSTSVLVDGNQGHAGISFVNGQFMGAPSVKINSTNTGPVKFTSCGFWGGETTDIIADLDGSGQTTFTACHFISWAKAVKDVPAIQLSRGGLTLNGCEFLDPDKLQVVIDKSAAAAIIMGNRMHGPIRVTNRIGDKTQMGLNAAC
jgi:hypothetical protein